MAGRYKLTVNFFNENDGASSFGLRVNGQSVGQWDGTGGQTGLGRLDTHTVELDLAPGDAIEIEGVRNREEYARLDSLDLTLLDADTVSPPPTLPPTPPSDGASLDVGLTEAEDLDISGRLWDPGQWRGRQWAGGRHPDPGRCVRHVRWAGRDL